MQIIPQENIPKYKPVLYIVIVAMLTYLLGRAYISGNLQWLDYVITGGVLLLMIISQKKIKWVKDDLDKV